jgi:putative intracellular protease/amidase
MLSHSALVKNQRVSEGASGGQDSMAKKVIIPLPDKDFDTTEVSIPWKHFVEAGLQVTFSTETGRVSQTDPRLLTGVIFGQLGAKPDAIANSKRARSSGTPSHTKT